jgi:hypothetical protein
VSLVRLLHEQIFVGGSPCQVLIPHWRALYEVAMQRIGEEIFGELVSGSPTIPASSGLASTWCSSPRALAALHLVVQVRHLGASEDGHARGGEGGPSRRSRVCPPEQ